MPVAAFTLTELLIGVAIGAVAILGVARLMVSYTNASNNRIWASQADRSFSRLSFLLNTEIGEGCALQSGSNPASCNPPSTGTCPGTAGTDIRVRVPVLNAAGTFSYQTIRYYLTGTQLLRDGPAILPSGRLDTATNVTGAVLVDNVSAFTPTVSADCRSVALALTFTIPNAASCPAATCNRTTRFSTKGNQFL
ncbi:hypothetical protein [Cyanobium sp. Morenito 9A2]|uniref:hypothetical protein n=1 Tax=Cyanobium sp. Morenito 9A2 TaxID=2823718 RepID=UPI0020CF7296|nr:hypothetical protein [Cyanobium sp. Morenito 9A2]MCP9848798.1 hypothetical protein [Cyanobium sp. Morenito 9A2]